MSHITAQENTAANLTFVTVSGAISIAEIFDWLVNYYSGEITRLLLFDCREWVPSKNCADIEKYIALLRKYWHRRKNGMTAFVFSDQVSFGMGRMVGSYTEIENSCIEVRPFMTLEGAIDWLGLPSLPGAKARGKNSEDTFIM